MISASQTTFSHYNLKILRPEVTKNIMNIRKKFFKFRPRSLNFKKFNMLRNFSDAFTPPSWKNVWPEKVVNFEYGNFENLTSKKCLKSGELSSPLLAYG